MTRSKPVMSIGPIGQRLSTILGVERLVSCKLVFDIKHPITAEITEYIGDDKVDKVLTLFEDGNWRCNHADETTMTDEYERPRNV